MASNSEYSQTLQHITDAKLEELSNKRSIFLQRKTAALDAAQSVDSPIDKVRALSEGVKTCFNIHVKDGRVVASSAGNRELEIALANLDRFLKQAQYDPAISPATVERWHRSLLGYLDVQALKYEYATLFAQLTMEWLSTKKEQSPGAQVHARASAQDDFEKLASARKLESRKEWEDFAFTPVDRDVETIKEFLRDLFTGSEDSGHPKAVSKALTALRENVATFEMSLARQPFHVASLNWVISGLLDSDLVTNKQRAALRDFRNDHTVLTELTDVLNMRLAALDAWSWGSAVSVEQRRQLNGSYQVHMNEDLIQAIFLQYIGAKWSVFFKGALQRFRGTRNVWKSLRSTVPAIDRKRRDFFLDQRGDKPSLQATKESIHCKAYFVSQLLNSEHHERRQEEGEQEAVMAKEAVMTNRARMRPFAAAARFMKQPSISSGEESDEEMGFGLFDGGDDDYDADQSYDDHWAQSVKNPANQMQAKQNLLLLLSADTIINKRLHGEVTCFRAQYESLYPSLPHPTILAVLSFLGVSDKWLSFFERFLTAPLRFVDDPDAEARRRRRGTPASHVLSEVFAETTLFCLDFMINNESNGEILWRISDDLWFWSRDQQTCVTAWKAIQRFNAAMGLSISAAKSGGAHITQQSRPTHPSLPSGKIRWGMLYLNAESGRFEIDQEMVDSHIEELKRQLDDKQDSVFGWIQAWNSYASTFFTYNFGTPANCFGREHVDMTLQTHERIQRKIFSSRPEESKGDSSVITYLRDTISARFGNTSIPDGYFFLPIDLGGLELSSPFINLVGLHDSVLARPDSILDDFLDEERDAYEMLKRRYEEREKARIQSHSRSQSTFRPDDADHFLSFEEYTRHRELLDYKSPKSLVWVYDTLLRRPQPDVIEDDASGAVALGLGRLRSQAQTNLSGIKSSWGQMTAYWKWVAQLYGPEIIERFGGFNVVDPGLLPIGLVSQFRSGRVSWREE